MAKNGLENERKAMNKLRLQRSNAYAEQVRKEFALTVNQLLALTKTVPELDEGVMFSYDGANKRVRQQADVLLRRLHSAVQHSIEQGIEIEWEQANVEVDKFVADMFGKAVRSNPNFSAWMYRNTAARDAFINRHVNGVNLSDRIWRDVTQLKEEMEVAMTVSIGEGESASQMSRKVRQYLNDPDVMFRRFKYKKGEKEVTDYDSEGNKIGTHKESVYGKKWKKKVIGEDGKAHFIDYDKDSYKTGKGIYKSSARNAMRVARSETNMAYRQADYERWNQLDFVLGQKIQTSEKHKEEKADICDKLAGEYPKSFKFIGWHPQCYCFATPIVMSEEERLKELAAKLKGEVYTPKEKSIAEMPENFNKWVEANKGKIMASRDNGTEPYFLRENADIVNNIIKSTD